ncbi:MAG: DUF1015 domain-containing protein, partial [Elusimicrobiota bacterium]
MVQIRAFRGLRPKREYVHEVASPPYDVISSDEARKIAAGNPHCFLHVTKPEIDLDPSIDIYSDAVYNSGAKNFNDFIKQGILIRDKTPCFYVYRLCMGSHIQSGLAAALSCADYEKDIIKKHEKTREDKENDRMRHILTLKAQTGPVFLTVKSDPRFKDIIESVASLDPEYDFTASDGVRHTVWVVANQDRIFDFIGLFARMDVLYIADGHHRSAAAVRAARRLKEFNARHTGIEEYNFFLGVIFPADEMNILEYNRVVKDINGLSEDAFLERLGERFDLQDAHKASPPFPHMFGIFLNGKWRWATAKPKTFDKNDPVSRLDVSILQNNVLEPLLGIRDPRRDTRIDFIGGIRGTKELEELVNSGKFKIAFSLFPVSIADLISIADA